MDALAEPEVVIDGGEPVPCQLEGQIRRQIVSGVLRPGEELPTVRALAVGLAVNPHAVETAYGWLQRDGFLIAGEGCGPRVAAPSAPAEHGELEHWCRDFLRRVTAEGFSSADVLRVLHACLDGGIGHGEAR
jgi:GntR family transcriptional regulator